MMPRARAFALVSLALLLASATASASSVALPLWKMGDEWTYEVKLVENGQIIQTGVKHVVVTARGAAQFHGASRDTVTLTTWLNLTGDPPQQWSDLRDAATGAFLATTSGGSTIEAAEPCADIAYPLEMDKRWTSTCDLGGGPSETSYQVVGGETLVLPAGTYDALTVDAIGDDVFRMWFADEACGQVAEFSQTNDLATYTNLTGVRCTRPTTPPTITSTTAPPTATTSTPTPAATPASSKYDYSCPPGTSHDNGSCLTSDADGDGSPLGLEQSRGTDPSDPDTDNDGIRDNDDRSPLTAGGAEDNRSATTGSPTKPAPGVGVGALLLVALLALRRKPS